MRDIDDAMTDTLKIAVWTVTADVRGQLERTKIVRAIAVEIPNQGTARNPYRDQNEGG